MRASLLSFSQNLDSLRYYLQALNLEVALLGKKVTSSPPSEVEALVNKLRRHLSKSAAKRRFDYNSSIVSLYGFLEQFIEEMLQTYAATLNGIVPKYDQLPEPLIKRHIELSYTLISRIEQTKYKSTATTPEIISNLHSCLSGASPYIINMEAFAYHSANFRTEVIDEAFSRLGVSGISAKVKEDPSFTAYLNKLYPGRDPSSVKHKEAFAILENLADRRNDVAHGINTDNILSNDILFEYIEFFEVFGTALYNVVRKEALPFVATHEAIPLGQAIQVFNSRIVCVCLKNLGVKLGDSLIAKTPDDVFYESEIQEIQVDHVSYTELPPAPSVDVGLKVDFHAKQNQVFMLLPQHLKRI